MAGKQNSTVLKQDTRSAELLLGASRLRLLSVLLLHPGPPLHMRALGRRARVALGLLQRELKSLERIGLLDRSEQGRHVVFGVRRLHPLVPVMLALVIEAAGGLPALLAQHLAGLDAGASVYLCLQQAAMDATVLLIVSDVPYERWLERTLPLETVLGRPILLRVMRPGQVKSDADPSTWKVVPFKTATA